MNVAAKLEDRPLPTGWISRQSKSRNKQYYFNTVTGKSSWKHPLDDETSIHVSNFWINKSSVTKLAVARYSELSFSAGLWGPLLPRRAQLPAAK